MQYSGHHPPFRFGLVASSASGSGEVTSSETLSRGAYPLPNNVRFLSRLKLRTIVSLTPDAPSFSGPATRSASGGGGGGGDSLPPADEADECDPVRAWVVENNITTIHIRVDAPTDDNEIPLSFKQAAAILNIIINRDHMPIYIHCLNGGVVTGLVCALLRKLMCWSPKAAIAEYARFLAGEEIDGTGVHEFVDRFIGEVEIPLPPPKWLWSSSVPPKKHPSSIRLKLPPATATTKDPPSSQSTTTTTSQPTTLTPTTSLYSPQPLYHQQSATGLPRQNSSTPPTNLHSPRSTPPPYAVPSVVKTGVSVVGSSSTTPRLSFLKLSDGLDTISPVSTVPLGASTGATVGVGEEGSGRWSGSEGGGRVSGVSVVSGSKRSVVIPSSGGLNDENLDVNGKGKGKTIPGGGIASGVGIGIVGQQESTEQQQQPQLVQIQQSQQQQGQLPAKASKETEKNGGINGAGENAISATLNALDLEM